jgi:hypothetical protein
MQISPNPISIYSEGTDGGSAIDHAILEITKETKCQRKEQALRQEAERNGRLRQKRVAADKLDEMATCSLASGILKGSVSSIDLLQDVGKGLAPAQKSGQGLKSGADAGVDAGGGGTLAAASALGKGLNYLQQGLKVAVDLDPAAIQRDYLAADRADADIVAERADGNALSAGDEIRSAKARQVEVANLLKEIDDKRNAATMEVMRG